MEVLFHLFRLRRRSPLKVFIVLIVLVNLVAAFPPATTFAAGKCQTSGPASAAYSLTVCITSPADGATVTGSRTINAMVTVTGTDPGISKLIFYLGGEYLITDYQSAYTFVLVTTKWVDGSRLLETEVVMKDGFVSQRTSITLNFNNGIIQPPINTKTFTPRKGTAPPAGQAFVLAAAGDGADGATNAGNVTDLIASWNPNLFLYLGDVYDDGTATEFRNWYGTSTTFYGRFRSITNPVIGNHEYAAGGVAPGYFDYWDNVPKYYSYDAAGWHFIALDSNCALLRICAPGQAEYQWLQNDLATHSNICTIAYSHHPVYNVGPEGYTTTMNDIWALLAQYGVDIVLNGHDHNYQRWKPLNGSGAVSTTGITQFVAGAGGHGTQQFITSDSRLAVGFDTTPNAFGALRLQLNQRGAGYQYINTAGTMLDSGSVPCSGTPADTTAPTTPTGLTASAVTPQLVRLTWTPSTDNVGVTGYSIYRDGSLLATIGPMATYDDATVLPGNAYSYQIRAQDAAGNVSALSSAAAVTTSLLLFSDGFESGNLSQWTGVSGLTVQQAQVYAGLYAARATSTGTAAYAYEQLSQTQNELYYRLWFKILSQGTNSVYLQRFRTGSNGAIMGVFISSTGKLAYRNDVTAVTTTSTTTVASGMWHELQVHVLINGTAGGTEVWLDGTRIDALSKTENLGTTPVGRIQLGDSSSGRTFDVALDQVALSTQFIGSANPPGSTATPVNTPTATRTPTPISTTTSTPTAIPSPTNTGTSSPGAGTYDDADPAWRYTGNWTAVTTTGPYNGTDHYSNDLAATASFTFRGSGFIFKYLTYSNRGSIEVWIDGVKVDTLNAYGAALVWQTTYTRSGLSAGTHTVVFKHGGPSGSYIDVDSIQVLAPVGLGVYDDTNPAWTYTGSWTAVTTTGPYNGTDHYSSDLTATASLTFNGSSFSFVYLTYSNRGSIEVWIDGVKVDTINANSAALVWQTTYTRSGLSAGAHTVVFKHGGPGGTFIDIDAIQIN